LGLRNLLILYFILTFGGPIYILASGKIDFSADWRAADLSSSQIALLAKEHPEAIQATKSRSLACLVLPLQKKKAGKSTFLDSVMALTGIERASFYRELAIFSFN